jgi:DNA-binding MarR family transcriptional regulator
MRANGRKSPAPAHATGAVPVALPHVTQMLAQKVAALNRALDRQAEAVVAARTDMRLIECRTLAYVEANEPIAVTDLAARMFIDGGQMSRLVSKLVSLGYVERSRNDDDQRSNHVRLTPRGRAAYARMQKSVHTWNMRLVARLDPEDVKRLNATLDQLTDFVAHHVKPAR